MHIYIKVLGLEEHVLCIYNERVSELEILNCHHNATNRNGYFPSLLQMTGTDSPYQRAPSPLQQIDIDWAAFVEYQTIFIQLKL